MKKTSAESNAKPALPSIDNHQRSNDERRRNTFQTFIYSFYKRRRTGPRRIDDPRIGIYVDIHEPSLVALVMCILLLCVMDVFFTLAIIEMGGEEVNPVMRVLLDKDVMVFFIVKFSLTASCLLFTVIHKHFRIFKLISGYHIIYGVFFMYMTLIYYEIGLMVPFFKFI